MTPHMAWLRNTALTLGGALAQGIVQILLSLIIAAMFWVQGETLRTTILEIGQRFGGQLAKNALQLAAASIRAVSYGILGTAVAQAMLLALGMWICGIPGAGVLGFIALIIALSQVGILLVLIWGGCAWWLYSNGETNLAIFMAIWGTIVSVIDNLLRPLLVGVAVTIPFTMIFFGVFGGFVAFGFLGMFIGPTLLAVFMRFCRPGGRQRRFDSKISLERQVPLARMEGGASARAERVFRWKCGRGDRSVQPNNVSSCYGSDAGQRPLPSPSDCSRSNP